MSLDPLPYLVLTLSLGGLFLLATAGKLLAFRTFAATLADYRLFPEALSPLIAVLVIALESVVVPALAVDVLRPSGFALAAALLLAYAGAMAINLRRGRRHIDCGCLGFGAHRPYLGWPLVLRNLGLAAVAVVGAALPVDIRQLVAIDVICLVAAPMAFATLYFGFGQLLVSGDALARGEQ
jgi:hypothetical protein